MSRQQKGLSRLPDGQTGSQGSSGAHDPLVVSEHHLEDRAESWYPVAPTTFVALHATLPWLAFQRGNDAWGNASVRIPAPDLCAAYWSSALHTSRWGPGVKQGRPARVADCMGAMGEASSLRHPSANHGAKRNPFGGYMRRECQHVLQGIRAIPCTTSHGPVQCPREIRTRARRPTG